MLRRTDNRRQFRLMIDEILSHKPKVGILIVTAVKEEQDVVVQCEADWQEYTDASGFACFLRQVRIGIRTWRPEIAG